MPTINRKEFTDQLEEDEKEACSQMMNEQLMEENGHCDRALIVKDTVAFWSGKSKEEIHEYFGDRYDALLGFPVEEVVISSSIRRTEILCVECLKKKLMEDGDRLYCDNCGTEFKYTNKKTNALKYR